MQWEGNQLADALLRAPTALAEDPSSILSTHKSVTPVPGDLILSSGLRVYQTHTRCTDIHAGKTIIDMKWKLKLVGSSVPLPLFVGKSDGDFDTILSTRKFPGSYS